MKIKRNKSSAAILATNLRIAQKLRTARLEAHMTQQDLADVLGVSFQQVQKYENGKNKISPARLGLAAKLLGRPASYFFDPINGGHEMTGCMAEFATHKDSIALAEAFNKISDPEMRQAIVSIVSSTARAWQ
jgi:transcriptional regulator with XRE-family HTH domain